MGSACQIIDAYNTRKERKNDRSCSLEMLIDGEWVDAEDGGTFESFNPATVEPWAEIPEATVNDVDRAVKAAHRAFSEGSWIAPRPRSVAATCAG